MEQTFNEMDIELKKIEFQNLDSLDIIMDANLYTLIEMHKVRGDVEVYNGYFYRTSNGSLAFDIGNDNVIFSEDLNYFDYFYCKTDDYGKYINDMLREKAYGKKDEPREQSKYNLHDWLIGYNGIFWRIEGKDECDKYVLSGRGYQIPQKATEKELDKFYVKWSMDKARKGCMLMSVDKTVGMLFKECGRTPDSYIAFAVCTRDAEDKPWNELNTQECERIASSGLVPMTDEESSDFSQFISRLGFDWSRYLKSVTDNVSSVYKVGDWLCAAEDNNLWYRITEVLDGDKCYKMHLFGNETQQPVYADDKYLAQRFVKWDITKAKDGMPLISKDGEISIVFKCIDADNPNTFRSHAFVRNYNCEDGHLNLDESENRCWLCEEFVPMARTVEKKFGEFVSGEGYGWDNLNKRLVRTTGEAKWVSDTHKPFDRVVVRGAGGVWKCAIYSHRNSSGVFVTTDSAYTQCLPYDDETARLVGTKDDYDGKYGSYYNE